MAEKFKNGPVWLLEIRIASPYFKNSDRKEVFALGLLTLLIYIKWQITKESFGKVKVRKFVSATLSCWTLLWWWAVFDEVNSLAALCEGVWVWLLLKPQGVVATRLSSWLLWSSMTPMDTFSSRRESATLPTTPEDRTFSTKVWPSNCNESSRNMSQQEGRLVGAVF